jgi:hypothetical protein
MARILVPVQDGIDEVQNRDRLRAAYRSIHDQMRDLLTPSTPYKEIDCHEIVSTIVEVLRRFEPEDSPLENPDSESPLSSPGFPSRRVRNRSQVANISNVRGNNNTQTTIFINGEGRGGGRVFQRNSSSGKRPQRGNAGGNSSDEDSGDDNTSDENVTRRKRTRDSVLPEDTIVVDMGDVNNDGDYVPPGGRAPPEQSEHTAERRTSGRIRRPTLKATPPLPVIPNQAGAKRGRGRPRNIVPQKPTLNITAPRRQPPAESPIILSSSSSSSSHAHGDKPYERTTMSQRIAQRRILALSLSPRATRGNPRTAPKPSTQKMQRSSPDNLSLVAPNKPHNRASRRPNRRQDSQVEHADDELSPT